jgi:GNAT superfamily N-acetyltransferase
MIEIELREGGCGRICRDLLADLSDWFGKPESNAGYEAAAETQPTWLALRDGEPCGLMILKRHEAALEIWLLAARRDLRRRGIGRALIAEAEREARDQGIGFLTVKTLGPSEVYEPYAETRAFYRAVGFTPLEEFREMWDPENPMLFMAKAL